MKIIPLTQGVIAIVDDHQFERLSQHKWCANIRGNRWYAVRSESCGPHKRKGVLMHREVLGAPKSFDVDHIHMDDECGVIDNREENLRLATSQQNRTNYRKQKNCSSVFKGVCWNKAEKCWKAKIVVKSKGLHLGYFDDEKDAALAYDNAAKKYFGEFASLNFNQQ